MNSIQTNYEIVQFLWLCYGAYGEYERGIYMKNYWPIWYRFSAVFLRFKCFMHGEQSMYWSRKYIPSTERAQTENSFKFKWKSKEIHRIPKVWRDSRNIKLIIIFYSIVFHQFTSTCLRRPYPGAYPKRIKTNDFIELFSRFSKTFINDIRLEFLETRERKKFNYM